MGSNDKEKENYKDMNLLQNELTASLIGQVLDFMTACEANRHDNALAMVSVSRVFSVFISEMAGVCVSCKFIKKEHVVGYIQAIAIEAIEVYQKEIKERGYGSF